MYELNLNLHKYTDTHIHRVSLTVYTLPLLQMFKQIKTPQKDRIKAIPVLLFLPCAQCTVIVYSEITV